MRFNFKKSGRWLSGGAFAAVFVSITLSLVGSLTANAQQVQQRKVAVILLNIVNGLGLPANTDPDHYRSLVFTGQKSVRAYYLEQSYGQISLIGRDNPDGDIYGPVPIYAPNSDYCVDWYRHWAVIQEATTRLTEQGANLSNYDHYIWIFPQDARNCGGASAPFLGRDVFVNYAYENVIEHEIGHNFGLDHAISVGCKNGDGVPSSTLVDGASRCAYSGYGDPFDVMGVGLTHVSAFNKVRLGFLPQSGIQTWSGDGVYRINSVQPNLGFNQTYVLRLPRQVGSGVSNGPYQNLYLEYRQPYGQYEQFASNSTVTQGVTVRHGVAPDAAKGAWTWTTLLDATPQTPSLDDAAWLPGMVYDNPIDGYRFEVLSVNGSYADVRVERRIDTTAPTISNFRVLHPTPTSMQFLFDTDDGTQATAVLRQRGVSGDFTGQSIDFAFAHAIEIGGLKKSTAYDFFITVTNARGLQRTTSGLTGTDSSDYAPPELMNGPQGVSECHGVPPVIGGKSFADRLQFSEPVSLTINYGTTTAYSATLTIAEMLASHCFNITGLTDSTDYHYQLIATDQAGNRWTSPDRTFRTIDQTPPKLYNLKIQALSATSVLVSWLKNEASQVAIEYGLTPQFGSSVVSTTGTSAVINGLQAGATYHIRAVSTDAAGNVWRSWTRTHPDTTPPQLIGLNGRATGDRAVFTWIKPEEASVVIEYGPTTSYGSSTPPATEANIVSVSGLRQGTYHYRAVATDPAGNVWTSPDKTFVVPDTTPPTLYSLNANVSNSRVVFAWIRGEQCNVVIEYGTTTSYGATVTQPTPTSSLAVVTGLPPGVYHYRATATDVAGNVWTSPDRTFTVPASP